MNALALVVTASLLAASPEGTIQLSPGMNDTVKFPAGITKIAIAADDIADIQSVSGSEVLLLGKRKGRTNLTVWLKNGKMVSRQIVVDDGRASELASLIHEHVNPVLDVRSANGKVIIDGNVDSMDEYTRLKKIIGDDPNVVNLVKLNPAVLPFLANQITQALRKAGLREAQAAVMGGRIVLEGSVADEAERQKAQMIADSYYAGVQFAR